MGDALTTLVETFGVWALLLAGPVVVAWMYATDRIVSAGRYADMADDRDFWRDLCMEALDVAERAAVMRKHRSAEDRR